MVFDDGDERVYSLDKLVSMLVDEAAAAKVVAAAAKVAAAAAAVASPGAKRKGKGKARVVEMEVEAEAEAEAPPEPIPEYCAAFTPAEYEALPPPAAAEHRHVRVSAMPSISPALLGHLQARRDHHISPRSRLA